MKLTKTMWVIQHVPSGSWDGGDTNIKLYWAEHEARLECVNEAFKPLKVIVTVARERK